MWQNAGMALSTPTLADEDTVRVTYTIPLRVSVTDLKFLQRGRCPSPSYMIVSQDYEVLMASFSLGRRYVRQYHYRNGQTLRVPRV